MVFAVQAFLAFRTAARRDLISGNIQTRLAQNVPWGAVERTDSMSAAGDPAVSLTVRFRTKGEADSFWADVQAAVGTGVNGPVVGSRISRHDCAHDAPSPASCVVTDSRLW